MGSTLASSRKSPTTMHCVSIYSSHPSYIFTHTHRPPPPTHTHISPLTHTDLHTISWHSRTCYISRSKGFTPSLLTPVDQISA